MDEDIKQHLRKDFVTKDDLREVLDQNKTNLIQKISEPCDDKEKCALHKEVDEQKKKSLAIGIALGGKLGKK